MKKPASPEVPPEIKETVEQANSSAKESTESRVKDYIFNWIVDRYSKNNHRFEFSDKFIWKGAIYVIPEIAGYLIFLSLFLWLGLMSLKRYGPERTYIFFMLLIIWRLNIMIKLLSKFVRKFE